LNLLLEGEICVCDLCEVLDVLQPSISRHLAYLGRAGLVTVRQDGKWKYYSTATHPDSLRRRLLNCVRSCLRAIDVLRSDLDRLHKLQRAGQCC
jgi:ArsR family transcriptional regulator